MTVAQGRSNVRAQIDIISETLEKMIEDVENKYRQRIDSVKAQIFDIDHDISLSEEEKRTRSTFFYETLDSLEYQLNEARCKLFICIYSICEASLRDICLFYDIPFKKLSKPKNKKDTKNKETRYYLQDYLYTLGKDSIQKDSFDYILSEPLRELRNSLIHQGNDVSHIEEIIGQLQNSNFAGFKLSNGKLEIDKEETLKYLLNQIHNFLNESEDLAKKIKL